MIRNMLAICAAAVLLSACVIRPPEVGPGTPMAKADPKLFTVFFDNASTKLSEASLSTLAEAASAYKSAGTAKIAATGYTDTVGSPEGNMELSRRRAEAVRTALVGLGVPRDAIAVSGRGEQNLRIPTGDAVAEPQNRRVEVSIK